MKKIILILKVLAFSMFIMMGCKKTPPPPQPPLLLPLVELQVAKPEPAWYGGSAVLKWTAKNADSVFVNGISVNVDSIVLKNLDTSKYLKVSAKNASSSVESLVLLEVFGKLLTAISKPIPTGDGKWRMEKKELLKEGTWVYGGLPECHPTTFDAKKMTAQIFLGECDSPKTSSVFTNNFYLLGDSAIKWNSINYCKVKSFDLTKLVIISKTDNPLGDGVDQYWQLTYVR